MSLFTTERVGQKIGRPIRNLKGMSYDEIWCDNDRGLIRAWENGREWRRDKPGVARRAMEGQLPSLNWNGGINDRIDLSENTEANRKLNAKYGTLYYLAQLQGLLDKDLDITPLQELPLMCSRTGWLVVFTWKYSEEKVSAGNALKICHTMGLQLREINSELAGRAEQGELPALDWPGGRDVEAPPSHQFGSLFYLAQWQGLRGEPWYGLTGSSKNMSATRPVGIKCAASGMVTVFTEDARKYLDKGESPDFDSYRPPIKSGIPKTYASQETGSAPPA